MAQIDPKEIEVVEVSPTGRPIGLDLIALESSRFGLEALGIGLVFWLCGQGLARPGYETSTSLSAMVHLMLALGLASLFVAVLSMQPTPNGPLPQWLRRSYALVFLAGLTLEVLALMPGDLELRAVEVLGPRDGQIPDIVLHIAALGLAWILWRFSQHRGLIGRALVWLWTALLWTLLFLAVEWRGVHWVGRLYPAVGVMGLFGAYMSARDLWIDAVNRKTKRIVAAQAEAAQPADG